MADERRSRIAKLDRAIWDAPLAANIEEPGTVGEKENA